MIVLKVLPAHILLHVLVIADELELRNLWNFLIVLVDRVLGKLSHSDLDCVVLVQRFLEWSVSSQHRRVVSLARHVKLIVLQVVLVPYDFAVLLLRQLVPQLLCQHRRHLLLCVLHVKVQVVLWLRALWTARVLV